MAKKFKVKYVNHTSEQENLLHKYPLTLKDGFMTIVEILFLGKNEFLADRPVFKIDF